MDLFTPLVSEDKQNPNFKNILHPNRAVARELLSQWVEGFQDRDGKLVKEFQTTFNTSFWEIYLYAVLKEYGYTINWSNTAPDFLVEHAKGRFCIEAVTANAAFGKTKEWELNPREKLSSPPPISEINHEAMIRLANALISKSRKYNDSYQKLEHVKNCPFIIAIAGFEQPHFMLQYNRPIRAVLYNCYVDEDTYLANPSLYPDGVPTKRLDFIEKDNGAEIPLGFFNNHEMENVSAVIFSCTASWGKVAAMAPTTEAQEKTITTIWGEPPKKRFNTAETYSELLTDGLQIYHNPKAKIPLDPSVFRHHGVVQHYYDKSKNEWVYEEMLNCLCFRLVSTRTLSEKNTR